MLLHILIDPVWYGSEQRCKTVRPLQPGQFQMQTSTVLGSNFGANQHLGLSASHLGPGVRFSEKSHAIVIGIKFPFWVAVTGTMKT